MGVKNVVRKIGQTAGDAVAKLAALSPEQLDAIRLLREEYLLQKPDPLDPMARDLTDRMMAASSIEIYNAFLPQLKQLYCPVDRNAEYDRPFDTAHNVRFINITKWVNDKQENNLEKLVNVYAVLSNEDCNIALIFRRRKENTEVYLAVVNTNNDGSNNQVDDYANRLLSAIRGNFPGAECCIQSAAMPHMDKDRAYSVAAASNIPAEKSEKFISQTIEKLLDGIAPKEKREEYTLILLATPIRDIEERKLKLGEFYSGLTPYASWQTDFHLQESKAHGSSATVGVNIGASAGVQNGNNMSVTDSDAQTDNEALTLTKNESTTNTQGTSDSLSTSQARSEAISETTTKTKGTSNSVGVSVGASTPFKEIIGGASVGGSYQHGWNQSVAEAIGKTATDTVTKGITNTISKSTAQTTGTAVANTLGKAVTKTMAATKGVSKALNFGANFGANFARSSTVTATIGKSEGITQTFTNYNIKHALELLETQMKRLDQSTALGMWDFAAYVVSEDHVTANNVAHSYLALTIGEDSYMSQSAINVWRGNVESEEQVTKEICDYLRELRHPVFGLKPNALLTDLAYCAYPAVVTATTALSGKELAYSLNFPQKAIAGLPILECAAFGRNIASYDATGTLGTEINLGKFFHMNHVESTSVKLSKRSLASHTFITGSTGSGKSNTIYKLLEEARKNDVKFLVIEPAKGEYKHIFGSEEDVFVYGTNPELSPMLRINPFSFPKGIHILEHLDRLIEIFNVCWPMYAAMPAVLKSAVEQSYEDCGWNLNTSRNAYGEEIYPSFADVARKVKEVIDSSEYDNDNKGAYKGALQTRLSSLANGLNGMIFVQDEIGSAELFDKNVIIDLSRVGSTETKSLIMGMLVLKLQEHRMVNAESMNSDLKHLTVLEEAHNLLKRTSATQSAEGANLMGKSVEMLSNAIAEMRTYGEGFIIADQAPGLLDMSVIRNTNTKIIMRLPDLSDRELVGKAASLNDDQIIELAKLPCGVAAVYQNEWVQPILCKVDKFDGESEPYKYSISKEDAQRYDGEKVVTETLLDFIMNKELFRKKDGTDIAELKERVIKSKLDSTVKRDFLAYVTAEKETAVAALRTLLYDFLEAESAIIRSQECTNITEWVHSVVRQLNPSIQGYTSRQIDLAMALLIYEKSMRDPANYNDILCRFTEVYRNEGGVF